MKVLRNINILTLSLGYALCFIFLNDVPAQEKQSSTNLTETLLAQRGGGRGRGQGGRGHGHRHGQGQGGQGRGGHGHGNQGKGGFGRGGMGQDHQIIFYLLEHRNEIKRKVVKTANGIETLTESQNPEVTAKIQTHVAAMYKRVENVQPIHMRDPLFRALFSNAKKIKMEMKLTPHGIQVMESSNDPFTVKLIQAHADVVSLFLKNGFAEVRKNHPVPQ